MAAGAARAIGNEADATAAPLAGSLADRCAAVRRGWTARRHRGARVAGSGRTLDPDGAATGSSRGAGASATVPRTAARAATARAAGRGRRGQSRLGRHARAHRRQRRLDRRRFDPRLRHGVELERPGDRLRGRRRARPDPHQPPRRDPGSRDRGGDLPQSRGSSALSRVPRSGARLRHLPLQPSETSLHQAQGAAALSRRGADRARDPRRRQQRRRATVDSGRNAGAARPRRARVRGRQIQRLQHLLPAGCVRDLGRLLRLAGHRHPRPGRGSQCGRREWRRLELLPAPRARAPRARADPAGQARAARHALYGLQLHALRRARAARARCQHRGRGAQELPALHRDARGHGSAARLPERQRAAARGHPHAPQRALRHAIRAARGRDRRLGRQGGRARARARWQGAVREAAGGRPARHHPERLCRVRRCGRQHHVLPAGAALQRSDARGLHRQPRLRLRRGGGPPRCADPRARGQENRHAEGFRGRDRAACQRRARHRALHHHRRSEQHRPARAPHGSALVPRAALRSGRCQRALGLPAASGRLAA